MHMKKMVMLLILSMSLAVVGCGSEVAERETTEALNGKESKSENSDEDMSEPEAAGDQGENPADTAPENSAAGADTDVSQTGPYGKISISLPEGWGYEACPMDSEKLMYGKYGIHFYPEGAGDGYVELAYTDSFGVCGTGLSEETVTVAGVSANIGTYDDHEYWDFIVFQGECDGIVALTYSVDGWWNEYGGQVMEILDTLSFDQSVKEGGAYIYHEESEIPRIGLYLTLKEISPAGATLVFQQYDADAPTGELTYGDDFTLEIQQGDAWESIPVIVKGDYGFNSIAYTIPAGESTETRMSWEWLYGELPPGEYRIGKTVHDFRESGDYDEYTVYGHFILAD